MKTIFVILAVFFVIGLFVPRYNAKTSWLLSGVIICMLAYLFVS